MRNKIKIPRIVKIEKITGHNIQCMFNNGESRLLNFIKSLNSGMLLRTTSNIRFLTKKHLKKLF